jgi:hypothetical protein
VARVSDPRGGCWTESGEILFSPTSAAALSGVPAGGGEARPITRLGAGEQSHRYPWALPGDEALLYTTFTGREAGIYWFSLKTQERKYLVSDVSRAAYDPRGFLVWVRRGALVTQRFEPRQGALSGEVSVIAEQVGVDPQKTGQYWYGLASGNIALRGGTNQQSQLRWFERSGAPAGEVTSAGALAEPVLSADDSRVAVGLSPAGTATLQDMWVFDTSAKDRGVRLSFEGYHSTPVWSRDGQSIFYTRDVGDEHQIVSKRADGSGAEELIYSSPIPVWADGQSPSEPLLVLEGGDTGGGYRLWLLPLEGDRRPQPFQQSSGGSQAHASLSPDGSLLAYTSDESGLPQIYVQPLEGAGVRWQVSSEGGDFGVWRSDGRELYYVGLDRVLRAMPIQSLTPFAVGAPEELFPLHIPPIAVTSSRSQYAPSRDGQRFLVNQTVRADGQPGMQVILGWSPTTPEVGGP